MVSLVNLFTYLYQFGHMGISVVFWNTVQYYFTSFVVQIIPTLAIGRSIFRRLL